MSDLILTMQDDDKQSPRRPMPPTYPIRERVALAKMGNPSGFHFYQWEFVEPDTILLTGCVVTRYYTRGPRQGRPVYDGPRCKVAVTLAEVEAAKRRFEAETGKCGECEGEGRQVAGWHHIEGTSYRPCPACSSAESGGQG